MARCSRAWKELVYKEDVWERRWRCLGWEPLASLPDPLLDAPPVKAKPKPAPPPKGHQITDLLAELDWDTPADASGTDRPFYARMVRAYQVSRPLVLSLLTEPSTSSSKLFELTRNVQEQCKLLCLLARFCAHVMCCVSSPIMQEEVTIVSKVRQATAYLETELRSAYTTEEARLSEGAASKELDVVQKAEATMHAMASGAWQLRMVAWALGPASDEMAETPYMAQLHGLGGYVIADLHIASRPLLNTRLPYNPQDCMSAQHVAGLHMEPFYAFAEHLSTVLGQENERILRIFPSEQLVAAALFERVAQTLLADYVATLLQCARNVSLELYLEWFVQSLSHMMHLETLPGLDPSTVQTILGQVWQRHLSDYLDAERDWMKQLLKETCDRWLGNLETMLQAWENESNAVAAPPSAAEKRSFLSTFKDALVTPAVSTRITPVSKSLEQIRAKRMGKVPSTASEPASSATAGYMGVGDAPDVWDDDDDNEEKPPSTHLSEPRTAPSVESKPWQMSSLLNLDTAMELIDVARLSLQRLEQLQKCCAAMKEPARKAVIDVVVALFVSLNEEHMKPGFVTAREQIGSYSPAKHDREQPNGAAADNVGPLLLFFELVQIGDTIQQMGQVFFDRLGPRLLGKMDFTNAAVREKRRFENDLDEQVASGLSAGVDLLVHQMEHIVLTHQHPRDYYPEADAAVDISTPTQACAECCATLRVYCDMLAACADKAVLDVFYEEIGFRLYTVLCKHLKRQIISLTGGFQVICDLNHYFLFIESLGQPSLTARFAALKRIGSLYIVSELKELAKMVQDPTLSHGIIRPEEMYEFLRARCDFKTIESNIDAEMYGIKIREDCVIM
ncbi:F-box protein: endocytic membrane traffic, recycling ReCYcling 1 [Malassezia nana]|uniref:F-box protein: endocytic membrane traffic, recycling ReCYcling 1 n=1 Tax=Malassezia nana TaxID=180528 RepID=A0AAF0EMW5_9BASI|nr:F-box protein: endocytic membrane traffic, recycling ReCYcling 1 [Malassezia nana]